MNHKILAPRSLALAAALLTLSMAAGAQAPAPAAAASGAGYVDPNAAPRRAAHQDVEPVPRAPAFDTLATIRKRGVLRVGVVQVPPMVMTGKDSRLVGFSIDVARRLADDLGVKLEFVETWWSEVIPDLLERRTDLIVTGLWQNVPRALVVNFTQPTTHMAMHLFASKPLAGKRRTLTDFNQPGVRIAVSVDPAQLAVAKARFPRATLVAVDDDALLVVTEGRAQAALVATLSAQAIVDAAPQRWFLPAGEPLPATSAAIAVRKGDPDFLAFLNTWLDIQREQGWPQERARHWATFKEAGR
ncbi:MAG: transporter substrate-binding domain-containing protein [Rubrivivax sp.]|nr:transporter substrate-binding domain-containing protein [Rubrivivax sp.]